MSLQHEYIFDADEYKNIFQYLLVLQIIDDLGFCKGFLNSPDNKDSFFLNPKCYQLFLENVL